MSLRLEAPPPPTAILHRGGRSGGHRPPPISTSELSRTLIALDREYHELSEADWHPEVVLDLLSQHLITTHAVLSYFGIGPKSSKLKSVLEEAIHYVRNGKKHPLLHEDAPSRPRPEEFSRRRQIEAEAAAALQIALDQSESQREWSEKIAEALERYGVRRPKWGPERPPGRFSGSMIIKWRYACVSGRHSQSKHFTAHLHLAREENWSADYMLAQLFS